MKRLGSVQARLLTVSKFALDGGAMFGIVPRPVWEREYQPDEKGRIKLVSRSLVLRFEDQGRIAIVDSGMGKAWSDKDSRRYCIDLSAPSIADALMSIGISTDEVTDAVMTHLHFDHAGGWTERNSDGKSTPVFANARHHVQKKQWDWAKKPSVRDKGSFFFESFKCIADAGLLNLLDGSFEVLPGLDVIALNGHTPGFQIPVVSGAGKKIAFLADLVPTSAHAKSAWIMAYDLFPLETIEEKKLILSRAADEDWVVALEHDPNIEAATVKRDGPEFFLDPLAFPETL
jgi:glyoxylase-like metal-dependent hydrolase (beta-lactamase superfamily II)